MGISITAVFLAGCGEKSATEAARESALTENAGNGEGQEAETPAAEEQEKLENEEQEEEEPAVPVGVLLPEDSTKEGLLDGTSFTEVLSEKNYDARVCYAGADAATQVDQFNQLVEEGVGAFVILPVDPYAFTEVFPEANAEAPAKLKLFSYDELIMDTDQLSYYVTFDSRATGHLTADRIIKDFALDKRKAEDEPLSIEFLMGSLDDMGALFYYNGILENLKTYLDDGRLVIRSGRSSFQQVGILGNKEAQAAGALKDVMKEFYADSRPDILVAGFDGAAYAAQQVFADAGFVPGGEDWPYITGFGCEAEAVRDIAEGRIRFSIYFDRRKLAEKCVDMVDTCLKGDSPEVDNYEQYDNGVRIVGTNICEGLIIDTDNYPLLIDNGYY
ncbi:MAG: substrate-binding domain-containing protein, partial [Clostridiales bacterium]|nr:substrate-binding domain-containing protein [Candidatus Blautia equi]